MNLEQSAVQIVYSSGKFRSVFLSSSFNLVPRVGFFSEFGLELFRRKHTVACASSDFSRNIDPEGKQGKLETRFLHVLPKSFFVVSPTFRALQGDARYSSRDIAIKRILLQPPYVASTGLSHQMPGTSTAAAETGVLKRLLHPSALLALVVFDVRYDEMYRACLLYTSPSPRD